MIAKIFWAYLFITTSSNSYVKANEDSISTSMVSMMELLKTERALVELSGKYINELQEKLDTIKKAVLLMRIELSQAESDAETYVSNPVNAFSLIRRMLADWLKWELFLSGNVGQDYLERMTALHQKMPTETDLQQAANSFSWLQETYNLKPTDIAKGLLNGKQYNVRLMARDLFTVGNELFKQRRFPEANYWIQSAIASYNDSDIYAVYEFSLKTIYELYADNLVQLNRYEEAKTAIDLALALKPNDIELIGKKHKIENNQTMEAGSGLVLPNRLSASQAYYKGCRGEFFERPFNQHCYYNAITADFLKLAPIKTELISLEPYIVMFHDIISYNEIKHLKDFSSKKLKNSQTYDQLRKKFIISESRTAKSANFSDGETKITQRLHQRIADMTGLIIKGSDPLQITNYGLGGHYYVHADFFRYSKNDEIPPNGNRIATVLIYLSDVEQGGATIFPKIEASIPPQKGSALMWYNLNNRGDGDIKTIHAACPVIVGSKWIATKWIREVNQFRKRPCYKE